MRYNCVQEYKQVYLCTHSYKCVEHLILFRYEQKHLHNNMRRFVYLNDFIVMQHIGFIYVKHATSSSCFSKFSSENGGSIIKATQLDFFLLYPLCELSVNNMCHCIRTLNHNPLSTILCREIVLELLVFVPNCLYSNVNHWRIRKLFAKLVQKEIRLAGALMSDACPKERIAGFSKCKPYFVKETVYNEQKH